MKTFPDGYMSLRLSRVACSLFGRMDQQHHDLAMKYQIIAPPRMRRRRLARFIELEAAKKEKKIQKTLSKSASLAPLAVDQNPAGRDGQNQNTQ